MKIVLIVTGYPNADEPARSVFNVVYAEELVRKGHSVSIIYLRSINPKRKIYFLEVLNNITIHHISTQVPFLPIYWQQRLSAILLAILLKKLDNNADVVQCIGGHCSIAGYLYSKLNKIPYLIHYIGGDLNLDIKKLFKLPIYRKSVESAFFNGFESNALKKIFDNYFTLSTRRDTIYRGINLRNYTFSYTHEDCINILFLGGMPSHTNEKGAFTVLKVIEHINTYNLKNKIIFYLGGPEMMLPPNFNKKINNPNIEVINIGAIKKTLVADYLKKSHIVLIPSLSEGLPNVMWEGMATGNLVIASRVGGIPEIIEHNSSGKLINPDDPNDLEKAIIESIENLPTIEQMAKNARSKVEQFHYDSFIKQYDNLYSQAVNLKNL